MNQSIVNLITAVMLLVSSGEYTSDCTESTDTAVCIEEEACCCPSHYIEARSDIIAITVTDGFTGYSLSYDNLIFIEEYSSDSTLYFQSKAPGRENIVISELTSDGVVMYRYAVTINEDMSAEQFYEGSSSGDIMPLI